jgi:hypothetical protein
MLLCRTPLTLCAGLCSKLLLAFANEIAGSFLEMYSSSSLSALISAPPYYTHNAVCNSFPFKALN